MILAPPMSAFCRQVRRVSISRTISTPCKIISQHGLLKGSRHLSRAIESRSRVGNPHHGAAKDLASGFYRPLAYLRADRGDKVVPKMKVQTNSGVASPIWEYEYAVAEHWINQDFDNKQFLLYDTDTPTEVSDTQLHYMLKLIREHQQLADDGLLRPFDNPSDGCTLICYFTDRFMYKLERYAYTVSQVVFMLVLYRNLLFDYAVKSSRNANHAARRKKRLYQSFTTLRQSNASVALLRGNAFQEAGLLCRILGRNLLLTLEINHNLGGKNSAHDVMTGIRELIFFVQSLPPSSAVHRLGLTRRDQLRWLRDIRDIRAAMKDIRHARLQRASPCLHDAHTALNWTYNYFQNARASKSACLRCRDYYYQKCRAGKDYVRQWIAMTELYRNLVESELFYEINALIKVINAFRLARLNRLHQFQRYPPSVPHAVLPDFVIEARARHREKYGQDAIF